MPSVRPDPIEGAAGESGTLVTRQQPVKIPRRSSGRDISCGAGRAPLDSLLGSPFTTGHAVVDRRQASSKLVDVTELLVDIRAYSASPESEVPSPGWSLAREGHGRSPGGNAAQDIARASLHQA